jgi:hypothetical protein
MPAAASSLSRFDRGGTPGRRSIKRGLDHNVLGVTINAAHTTTATDKLTELSNRAKTAEEHAEAAETKAKAELEPSADEAQASAQAQADKLREAARSGRAAEAPPPRLSRDGRKNLFSSWGDNWKTTHERRRRRHAPSATTLDALALAVLLGLS